MTIIEGKIETIKRLKETLIRNGVTRFNSIGEITRFLKNYEMERKELPSIVEKKFDAEIQLLKKALDSQHHFYLGLKTNSESEIKIKIDQLDIELSRASEFSKKSLFYKIAYYLKIKNLINTKLYLENNFESIVNKNTYSEKEKVDKLTVKIADNLDNRKSILFNRCNKSLEDLARTKTVVDELYPLIAGAIGETSVVKTLQQLSDDCYLFNDFSVKFNPPLFNSKENERIFSIQVDHLLVCKSGIFLLETKNWSSKSLENIDLRSPVTQILRTSFGIFSLINRDSKNNRINLEQHHWGSKKIPIRNIIVMTNDKPKNEFKHVKILSLGELNGYIQYFEPLFSAKEVKSIFEYLKSKMEIYR